MMSFKVNLVLFMSFVLSFGLPTGKDNSCNCVCGIRGRSNRIVGGDETAAHEFPWLSGLSKQGKLYCGASLISDKLLLTAAHCVYGTEPREIRVYLGGHNITKDYSEQRRVKRIIEHEDFNIISFNNDIAILEMDKPVKFGPTIQPVCLPDINKHDYSGSLTVVAGWGRTNEKEEPSKVLRSVILPVWSPEQCSEAGYGPTRLTENMLCAGYHDGRKDACQGDSGGPMHMEGVTGSMEIIGLVSWGRGCARPNLPGLYTRVINYLPWINNKIRDEGCMCSPKMGQRTNYLEHILQKY